MLVFFRTLRHGMHDLKVWPEIEADGKEPSSTPGETTTGEDKMSRLAKVQTHSTVTV